MNSLDPVITVWTVDELNRMDRPPSNPKNLSHCDSSRGPGQLASRRTKPDCVAPTYGEVLWGSGYTPLEWWGSSGAAAEVSGLAALMLSESNDLSPEDVYDILTATAAWLPLSPTCVGAGLINCTAALEAVRRRSVQTL